MSAVENLVLAMAQSAKEASRKLALVNSVVKNKALEAMALSLERNRGMILAENALDLQLAREKNLSASLLDRLTLNDARLDSMIAGIRTIAELSDPVGKLITSRLLANNLELKKVRVPLGVIAIIFEARPNVVADVAALCIKSGNAVILRGGSEAEFSNKALMNALQEGLALVDFTPHAINLIPIKDYDAVNYLCRLDNYVDLIIPRGGEGLIKAVVEAATVPVIKHYKGICTIFVDQQADINMALSICHNAKCQRPSACNAVETILVHENIAASFIPKLEELFNKAEVQIRACEKTRTLVPSAQAALSADWDSEYGDRIVALKIIPNLEQAIKHINTHGTHLADAIISADREAQQRFTLEVDSACVYINASTRFTDGAQFGLGAEMGISTDKFHARGPMGLNELTTYKWVGVGAGQIRE